MKLCDINPFLRYAELQPSVMSSAPLSCSYDYRIFYILEGNATFEWWGEASFGEGEFSFIRLRDAGEQHT